MKQKTKGDGFFILMTVGLSFADTLAYIQVKIGYPMSKAEGDIYQAALGRILKNQYDQIILQLSKEQEEQRKKDSTGKPKTK